ncbi:MULTISPECIES: DUF7716 domain-containing protein [Pseudomonas]|uniref:DUF7716 domain-containing protein n=1 Tax=Pseudomonas quercus TaxID=2722792 RepID=A0ABX0YD23_9PSED|nr:MULTISPECIES: hypothetical protein [Pseudomonas]MBF7142721.1 hypothetical protein [Pseudomonas sp. LY10J]NJP01259.1 hypothetical protein [Pseudomonas quercus]
MSYKIKEILLNVGTMPNGWLYLPNTEWTLETVGAFSLDSKDFPPGSTDHLPDQALREGWVEVLETAMIEDVIDDVDRQLITPNVNDYFEAFKFFYEHDAFITFDS